VPTFKLTLEYDGSRYHGWQIQPNLPTIQGALEAAVRRITQQPIKVIGAGRTDAGVHALGQVAGFTTSASLSSGEWLRALNGLLPRDIAVLAVEPADAGFHPRFSATSKLYRYRLLTRSSRPALDQTRVWHIPHPIDIDAMTTAAVCLTGTLDFSSFQGSPTDATNPVCMVHRVALIRSADEVFIEIEANRFLKQMVRNIVGTLIEIGRGRLPADAMKAILDFKDRRKAGPTAPAYGLYLVRVDYESRNIVASE
jgi:tRNA pseudouridine38-40 synthase